MAFFVHENQPDNSELKLWIRTDPEREYFKDNLETKSKIKSIRKLSRRADFNADVWQLMK